VKFQEARSDMCNFFLPRNLGNSNLEKMKEKEEEKKPKNNSTLVAKIN